MNFFLCNTCTFPSFKLSFDRIFRKSTREKEDEDEISLTIDKRIEYNFELERSSLSIIIFQKDKTISIGIQSPKLAVNLLLKSDCKGRKLNEIVHPNLVQWFEQILNEMFSDNPCSLQCHLVLNGKIHLHTQAIRILDQYQQTDQVCIVVMQYKPIQRVQPTDFRPINYAIDKRGRRSSDIRKKKIKRHIYIN